MSSMTQCTACPLCLTSCAVPEVSVSSGQSSGIFSADRLVFESSSTDLSVLHSPSGAMLISACMSHPHPTYFPVLPL